MKRRQAFGRRELSESATAAAIAPQASPWFARLAAAFLFAVSLVLFTAACGVFGWAVLGLEGPGALAAAGFAAFVAGFAVRGMLGRR